MDTSIAIPVVLSHPTTETVEVTWSTVAGTATAGTIDDNNNPTGDFIEQLDQTLEITDGVSANIVISINEDNIPENSEIFEVRLTAVTNATFATGETQISVMVSITDNDADPQISIDTTAQVGESEGNAMIPVTIQGHRTLERSMALTLTTTTGTATATDFTEQDEEVYTIPGSSWVQTRDENVQPITVSSILIPITADEVFERDETFTVAYSELSGATFTGGSASPTTITIIDDDNATISIADNSVTESDSGAVNITFDVTLSKAVDREITVNWNAATDSDDTAEFGSDYANVNNSHLGSLTFDIGETSKQISLPVADDTILEGDETFTVTLTEISNGVQYAKQSATGTIIDNETDPILTATAPTSVNEDAGELEITATLSAMTHAPVTVEFTTTDGTATGSGDNPDFEAQTNQTYTIPPLTLTHTFTLPITDDLFYEGNETFTLTLSNANHATISGISGTIVFSDITINDNETSPQISLENTTPSILEGSGQLFLNVNLNSTLTDAITVMYETIDGTSSNAATSTSPNIDFTAISKTALNFPAGETTVPINVTINDDQLDEGNETFTIKLTEPSNNATFANSATELTATVTIADDDSQRLMFKTTDFNHTEYTDGTHFDVVVQVLPSLNSQSATTPENADNDITFDITLEGGNATKGSDYTNPTQTSYTISSGNPEATISIPISNDSESEGDETFELTLTNLTGASFASSNTLTQTITIVDDELQILRFTESTATVSEGDGTIDLEVEVNGTSDKFIQYYYETANGTGDGFATPNSDFTPTSGASQAAINSNTSTGTIQLTILDDNVVESDETFTVTLVNPQATPISNAMLSETAADLTMTITIEDDDTDLPILSIAGGPEVTEGPGVIATYIITADKMPSEALTVHYLPVSRNFLAPSISNVPQMSTQPLTFVQPSENAPITARLSFPIFNDTVVEPNGPIAVTLQDPPTSPSTPAKYQAHETNHTASVKVIDDDSVIPVLAITGPSGEFPESVESVEFTVTAYEDQTKNTSINPGRTITIQYTPTEVAGGDYLATATEVATTIELSFTGEKDGNWTSTISVPIAGNTDTTATGKIKVTLNDDPATTDAYIVSTGADKSAEANFIDDERPIILRSIGIATLPDGTSVTTEQDNVKAVFTLIANVVPTAPIPLKYRIRSNFIADAVFENIQDANVTFVKNEITGRIEGKIEHDIVNDELDEGGDVLFYIFPNDQAANYQNYFSFGPSVTNGVLDNVSGFVDDDPKPTVSVANLTPSVAEDGTSISIPVTLSNPTLQQVSMTWSTSDGTAIAGSDYEAAHPKL